MADENVAPDEFVGWARAFTLSAGNVSLITCGPFVAGTVIDWVTFSLSASATLAVKVGAVITTTPPASATVGPPGFNAVRESPYSSGAAKLAVLNGSTGTAQTLALPVGFGFTDTAFYVVLVVDNGGNLSTPEVLGGVAGRRPSPRRARAARLGAPTDTGQGLGGITGQRPGPAQGQPSQVGS